MTTFPSQVLFHDARVFNAAIIVIVVVVIVVVVHVFDIVVVGPRNLSLKVGQNQVINRPDFFVGIVVVVDFVVLLLTQKPTIKVWSASVQ